jgi:hypothetical protein
MCAKRQASHVLIMWHAMWHVCGLCVVLVACGCALWLCVPGTGVRRVERPRIGVYVYRVYVSAAMLRGSRKL